MNCHEIQALIVKAAGREAVAEEFDAIQVHTHGCMGCRNYERDIRTLWRRTGEVTCTGSQPLTLNRPRVSRRWTALGLTVAAAVLLGIMIRWLTPADVTSSPPPEINGVATFRTLSLPAGTVTAFPGAVVHVKGERVTLDRGEIFVALHGEHNLVVETPAAKAIPRGTEFFVHVSETSKANALAHWSVEVTVIEGTVEVINRFGKQTARAGEAVTAQDDSAPNKDRYGDPLPSGAIARMGTQRFRHRSFVRSVAFSPDGTKLASGSRDKTVVIWDVASGKRLHTLIGHERQVDCVAFSRDGTTVASGGGDGMIHLWEVATGKLLRTLRGHQSTVFSVTFSPDRKTLASAGHDTTVRLWEVASGKERLKCTGHTEPVWCVAFSADGETLASASADKSIRLWDAETGKENFKLEGHNARVTSVAFSPKTKSLASLGSDLTIRLWNAETGEEQSHWYVANGEELEMLLRMSEGSVGAVFAFALAFSPDGKTLATSVSGKIRLWKVATRQQILELDSPMMAMDIAFSPDGRSLASADMSIRLWDVTTGKQKSDGHAARVSFLAFSPDGKTLASGSMDKTMRLWETATGKELHRLDLDYLSPSFAASPDGTAFASGEFSKIRLWDMATGKGLKTLNESQKGPLAFSPDGKILACWNAVMPSRLFLFELSTGKDLLALEKGLVRMPGLSMVFSPDGKSVAVSAQIGEWRNLQQAILIFQVATGKQLLQIDGAYVRSLAFSPDGLVLVSSGDSDYKTRFWEVKTGREILSFENGYTAALSADGKLLASGSKDGTIRIREMATGNVLLKFKGHSSQVDCLAFSRDGMALASGGTDTSVLVWDLAPTGWRAIKHGQENLEKLWTDLVGDDAENAYEAIWTFAAEPEKTVPFMRKRLGQPMAVDENRVHRLIAQLDNDEAAVREKALGELEKLGLAAEPALRKALNEAKSPEVGARLKAVLKALEERPALDLKGEVLRRHRAIHALERIGTKEAREALKMLGTRDAQAALKRLEVRDKR